MPRSRSVAHRKALYLVLAATCLTLLLFGPQPTRSAAYVGAYEPGQTYWGRNHYIEYIAGDLPLVLSIPHGGTLRPDEIADRTWGARAGPDPHSLEYALEVADHLYDLTGHRPHIIINHLHRIKLDANRDLEEAAQGDPWAEQAWREFHAFIDDAEATVAAQYGRGLYLDLHSNVYVLDEIQLGIGLSAADLSLSDVELSTRRYINRSHLRNLGYASDLTFAELVRGSTSLGGLLSAFDFNVSPSPARPQPNSEMYYNGGYNVARHGSRDGGTIDGIQIEVYPEILRDNVRAAYTSALAQSLVSFLDIHYGLTFDPGGGTPTPTPTPTATPYPELSGFPLAMGDDAGHTSPLIADMDGDGANELLAATRRGEVFVWNAEGIPRPGYPLRTAGRITGQLAMGDLDGNGELELVAGVRAEEAGAEGQVYVWQTDGTLLPGWPQSVARFGEAKPSRVSSVVLADLDNDADLEVLAATNNSADGTPQEGLETPNVYAWDHTGALITGGWPITAQHGILGALTVGDLNGDGQSDILFGRDDRFAFAYDAQGSPLPGWPVETLGGERQPAPILHTFSAPALADLDADGQPEYVAAGLRRISESAGPAFGDLLVLQPDGSRRHGWEAPASSGETLTSTANMQLAPAVADLNADNELDIVLATPDGWIRAYRANNTLLWAFDYAQGQVIYGSEPVIGDVDDDGLNEVVFGSYDPGNSASGFTGLWVLENDGTPKFSAPLPVEPRGIMAAPILADLNQDGYLDIVAVSQSGVIHAWDTGSRLRPLRLPWPMARHDLRRSGAYDPASVRTGRVEILCDNQVFDGYTTKPFVLDSETDQDPTIQKVIRNCTFRNSSQPAVVLRDARNVLIEGNTFENIRTHIPGDGVHAINIPCRLPCAIDTVVIRNNTFADIGADGIQLGEEGRFIGQVVIENNVFTGSDEVGENAVDVKGVDGPIYVLDNTIQGFRPCESPKSGGQQDCSGSAGAGMVIHSGSSSGIPVNVTVRQNRFLDNTLGLVVSRRASHIIVRDNVFSRNLGTGLLVARTTSIQVLNNVLEDNPRQIYIYRTPLPNGVCVLSGNTFRGNGTPLTLEQSVCSEE